jgi:surface antigen Omp85-like protein
VVLTALPARAAAQDVGAVTRDAGRNIGGAIGGFWRREDIWTAYPAILPLVGGQDELGIALGFGYRRPPHSSAPPIAADFQVVTEFGTSGSVDVRMEYKAPGLQRDWRHFATARYQLMPHAPYLGVGNDSVGGESYQPSEDFYEYRLERWTLWAGVEHRIAPSLWLLAGIHSRYYVTNPRRDSTGSLYGIDVLNGVIPRTTYDGTAELRLGLVHDSRDAEVAPTRGLYLQWLVAQAARVDGSKHSYRRVLVEAQEFLPVARQGRMLLALRQSLSASQDSLPWYIGWEQLVRAVPQQDGVVGSKSIRLHGGSDYMATNRALLSADLRYIIVNESQPYWAPFRIWAGAFGDMGQLWDPQSGTHRRLWAGGAGVRFQMSKAILYGMDLGYTDRGWAVSFTDFFSF